MITRIEKKKNIDSLLLFCVYALVVISFIAINSAVSMVDYSHRIIRTHIVATVIGSIVMFILWKIDYELFDEYSNYIYGFSLLMLIAVLFFGVVDKGSRSWFRLPFFSIQPSEFARIALIIFLSSYLYKNPGVLLDFAGIMKVISIIFPFFFLMMKQPDFSGLLITLFPIIVLFLVSGINLVYFYFFALYGIFVLFVPALGVIFKLNPKLLNNDFFETIYLILDFNVNCLLFLFGLLLFFIIIYFFAKKFNPLVSFRSFITVYLIITFGYLSGIFVKDQIKDYQYKRIESFIYPHKDPRGAGYNIIQARVALGSGGFLGKGIFKGSQTRLGFIPERHTDFIVSVIGEEMGFIGVMVIIVLYLVIINRIKNVSFMVRNFFAYNLCCGFAGLFMGYFFINIGMILGFFPVAGIPLPFVSYGGSNLVASFAIVGIIQSIYRRRFSIA